jgi:hypothetical protein
VKIYLDVYCLNRLTDDQSQARIREEAEATERVLARVRMGSLDMISSEAVEGEARRNPSRTGGWKWKPFCPWLRLRWRLTMPWLDALEA